MDLYVLDKDFNQIAVIDDFKSLIWAKRYSNFGDCELYIRACGEYIDTLNEGYYLVRNDDDMVCRLKSVELDSNTEQGDFLIAVGQDVRCLLDQRVIWEQTNFTGTVEKYIRKLVTDNVINPSMSARTLENIILGDLAGLTATISEQVTYAPLGEKIIEICNAYSYGTRMWLNDANQLVFDVYEGVDRSYDQDVNDHVVFSSQYDNIISSKYKLDWSNLKNVVLVAGEGEGVARRRYILGTMEGYDRYELYVDARDVSSEVEEGQTIDYAAALRARGIEALGEYGTTISFEGEVEPNYSYKYGLDYKLGDIVQVMTDYGVSSSARITEVIETFDENGYSIIPTFEYRSIRIDDAGQEDSGSGSGGDDSGDDSGTVIEGDYEDITNEDIDNIFETT